MNRFILRFGVMFLTFIFALATNFLFNGLGSVLDRWIENPQPVLEEPCTTMPAEQPKWTWGTVNCRTCLGLVVTVGHDRSLKLNGIEMGSLDDPSRLVSALTEIFTSRTNARIYGEGIDLNSEDSQRQRMEKTVLIKAVRSLSYGDMSDLIEVIKATGAGPISLVTDSAGCSRVKAMKY